jgi:thiamine pyrophosphate-dependent acetolactate synthase large subunit-like protein
MLNPRAAGYGLTGGRVTNPEELKDTLQCGIAADVPRLTEVVIDATASAHLLQKYRSLAGTEIT